MVHVRIEALREHECQKLLEKVSFSKEEQERFNLSSDDYALRYEGSKKYLHQLVEKKPGSWKVLSELIKHDDTIMLLIQTREKPKVVTEPARNQLETEIIRSNGEYLAQLELGRENIETLKRALEEAGKERDSVRKEYQKLEAENKKNRERIISLASDTDHLLQESLALRSERDELTERVARLKKEGKDYLGAHQESETDKTRLKNTLTTRIAELTELYEKQKRTCDELTKELCHSKERYSKLEEQLDKKRNIMDILTGSKRENKALKERVGALETEIRTKETTIAEQGGNISDLESLLHQTRTTNEELTLTLSKIKATLGESYLRIIQTALPQEQGMIEIVRSYTTTVESALLEYAETRSSVEEMIAYLSQKIIGPENG